MNEKERLEKIRIEKNQRLLDKAFDEPFLKRGVKNEKRRY